MFEQKFVTVFLPHAKGGDNETKAKYALKAATTAYSTIYFFIATVWGYYVLKDTKWLPWWMGGPNDGGYH